MTAPMHKIMAPNVAPLAAERDVAAPVRAGGAAAGPVGLLEAEAPV